MKFLTLALDYDGTVAQNDVLDPSVRAAIAELRARGVVVLLVTGRILDDLRRVAGDLHFVDGVVAENGAVVAFPSTGYSSVLGSVPPSALLVELRREGIPFRAGQVVVEADRDAAPRILAILQRLEAPLTLVFNRGRVMALPQAISKATGLHRALTILRLSEHNTVAIGDAENDHELLRASEVGVAVAWGSEALKASADYTLPGSGPADVAEYIRALGRSGEIPAPRQTRRRLQLGHTDDGQPLSLAIRGRNVLVAGDPKSGKSWVTGLMCEQRILYGYCLCIIDPEGDYASLEALPGVIVYGGADPLPKTRDLLRALRHPDVSVVIDLSHTTLDGKLEYLRSVLPALAILRRRTGLPHQIVVDEAHYFLHDPDVRGLLDLELGGYTLVTYRASKLHPDVLAASQAVVVTRESDPREVAALDSLCQPCHGKFNDEEWRSLFGSLVLGEAVTLPITDESEGALKRIRLAPRLTPHVRHVAKYIDIPVSESRSFFFWPNGTPTGPRARTLREFVAAIEQAPAEVLTGHLSRRDFSNWIGNVLGDYPLANAIRTIEDAYKPGASDIGTSIAQTIRTRYEFVDFAPELKVIEPSALKNANGSGGA